MSFKAKDLHYEKQEPAFLRRLKGAYEVNDGRSNVQIARPKKDRLKTGDGDDDEPLILDENGDVVGKKEFDGMVKDQDGVSRDKGNGEMSTNPATILDTNVEEKRDEKQQIAAIGGGGRKRKQIKAVGGGSDDEVENVSKKAESSQSVPEPRASNPFKKQEPATNTKIANTDKVKKKAKKIKLSFDEPE